MPRQNATPGGPSADASGGRGESVRRAYDQLRELIVHGRLAPGSRIIESDLADRLGVSRTPIRSALHRLQQEGYVASVERAKEPRLIVAPLTQSDAMELFEIIGQLEGLAARAAAERPPKERLALVKQLRALNGKFETIARTPHPDPSRLFEVDMRFHHTFVAAAAGPRLLALHDAIKPQAERYARLYSQLLQDEIAVSVAEHAILYTAIEAGSPPQAEQAAEYNWHNAAARLTRAIGVRGELGSW